MKIQFDEITVSSKTKSINVFDGEKDIIISKKDFEPSKYYRIPINQDCMSHGKGTMVTQLMNYKPLLVQNKYYRCNN